MFQYSFVLPTERAIHPLCSSVLLCRVCVRYPLRKSHHRQALGCGEDRRATCGVRRGVQPRDGRDWAVANTSRD